MTRLGRETTAEEIARAADLRGRRAVLTGATSGIGRETARALAIAGAGCWASAMSSPAGRSPNN
jgi:NADP-dependent 3-hydroxy acid dehydrogenase YdfG